MNKPQLGLNPFEKQYSQLVGMTVVGLAKDRDSDIGTVYGLIFRSGKELGRDTIAWIMQDPEGNGAGFLEIQKA